ncbi:MAG: GNAT family N-acetyltransferase [Rhodomicrobiaceae bacterium]
MNVLADIVLQTDRFLLRDYREADRHAFLAYQADPDFIAFRRSEALTADSANAVFDKFLLWRDAKPRLNFQFAIWPSENATETIGSCGIRRNGCAAGEAEFGMELAPAFWGQGAGAEIGATLIGWAWRALQLNAIHADTAPDNRAAARLAEKLGFSRTGLDERQHWRLGKPASA